MQVFICLVAENRIVMYTKSKFQQEKHKHNRHHRDEVLMGQKKNSCNKYIYILTLHKLRLNGLRISVIRQLTENMWSSFP